MGLSWTHYSQPLVGLDWRATTYGACLPWHNFPGTQSLLFRAVLEPPFIFLLPVRTQEGLLQCLEPRAHKNGRIRVTILSTDGKFQPVWNFT